MSAAFDPTLIFALAITVAALGFFIWHLLSRTKQVADLISDSRVPRRYLLLGLACGIAAIYWFRR